MIGLQDVREAAAALTGQIVRTPTVPAPSVSDRLGCRLFLKLENLQTTGSFKERGALNRLCRLGQAERARGVIATSAGNHAQGVAYHARRLGIPATIVMPRHTPFTKVEGTESFGATVVLHGDDLSAAEQHAAALAEERGLTVVHPYDDPHVIAGQGTIALELLDDAADIDDIVVPIGGGGLISGIAVAAKALRPDIRIIGVEADLYPSMSDALRGVSRDYTGATIAEGIAVKRPGALTLEIVRALVDDIVLVEETALERAIHLLLTGQKLLGEGAGVAGLAALLAVGERFAGRRVATILCGGNIDARLLASVMMRGLVRDGHLVRLMIGIDDSPGMLGRVAAVIGKAGGNIVEVYHHRLWYSVSPKRAELELVVETRDRLHARAVRQSLAGEGFTVTTV